MEERYLIRANDAIKGNIFLHRAVGSIKYKKDIWNDNLDDKTFQVYVHSLPMITYLTDSYIKTEDEEFIKLAKKIIDNWILTAHRSKYTWHEQPVSSRLKNFVYYQFHVNQEYKIEESIYEEFLLQHTNFLMEDNNYKENNHGGLMDKNLASILPFLSKKHHKLRSEITQIVTLRARNTINRDFSYKGLHLENSPDYHRLVIKWLFEIENNLNMIYESLGESYINKINRFKELEAIIVKPNKRYPLIGDSSAGSYKGVKSYENLVDYEAGRVVLHNKNNKSQLTFMSGYGTRGHKHFDDLSFTFFDGETDIFDDSGKYNYKASDPLRKHVKSPLGHNSLSVYKKNYQLSDKYNIKSLVGLSDYTENEDYYIVSGFNNAYPNLSLKRTLIYTKTNNIIIIDSFFSRDQHVIAQNFNLGLDVTVKEQNDGAYLLKGSSKNYIMKSHHTPFTRTILNNTKSTPCIISNSFNKYEENQRLLFKKKTKSSFFVTTIINTEDSFNNLEITDNEVSFQLNKKNYQFVI